MKDASGKETTAESIVTVNAKGIETLNVVATGANVVDLSGVAAATSVNAKGEGNLKVANLAASVKAVDASAMTGKIDLTLGNAASVKSVATGAGDDVINATAGDLTTNAEINGGAGADKLVLKNDGDTTVGTTQYAMSNVETVEFNGATATFSAKNVEGVESYVMKGASTVKLADMGKADLNLTLSATEALAGSGSLTSDHTGNAVINVSGGVKDHAATDATALTFTKAGAVDLTVAQYNTMTGNIIASEATSLTANVAGVLNDTVTLKAATSAVFNMTNTTTASTVALDADKMTELQISTDANFTLGENTKLGALQNLTVDTDAVFTATDAALAKIANVNLSGTATAAKAILGNLGTATGVEYGITVEATGLTGGLEIASIKSAHNVTVNAAGVMGNVKIGTITENTHTANTGITGDNVTFIGSELAANSAYISAAKSATIKGGAEADTFMIVGSNAAGTTSTFDLTGGLGEDKFMIDYKASLAGKAKVTINDFTAGEDKTNINVATLEKFADAATAKAFLSDAFGITADVTLVSDNTSFAGKAFTDGTNTYLVVTKPEDTEISAADGTFDDGEIAIKLVGTFTGDELAAAFAGTSVIS